MPCNLSSLTIGSGLDDAFGYSDRLDRLLRQPDTLRFPFDAFRRMLRLATAQYADACWDFGKPFLQSWLIQRSIILDPADRHNTGLPSSPDFTCRLGKLLSPCLNCTYRDLPLTPERKAPGRRRARVATMRIMEHLDTLENSLPEEFIHTWQVGEQAGSLADAPRRLAETARQTA